MNNILIIEDDPLMRELIQQILDLAGFSTITAEDGLVGLNMIKEHHPILIMCDVMMPHLDGYSLIEILHQDPVTALIPFIFLTAKDEHCDLRQAMSLGADDYLSKPFNAEELLEAITTQLKKREIFTEYYLNQVQQMEAKLMYLDRHDSLTGLPNQFLLEEHFNQTRLQAYNDRQILPLLLIDINIFHQTKLIFESSLRQLLLKAVATKLNDMQLQNHAIDLISYLQTDKLVILLKSTLDIQVAADIAQKILDNLSQPLFFNNQEISLTAKIGITCYPDDGLQLNELLTNAEVALEHYKQQDTSFYHFSSPEILKTVFRKTILATDLNYALARNEFQLYYQPQINITTGQVVCVEALIRWQHPEHGFISPAEFIPIAEKSGFIIPLGDWILKTVCHQLVVFQSEGLGDFNMAVNISACQFANPDFSQRVIDIITETSLAPKFLELELTESVFIEDVEVVKEKLNELCNHNIQISIDDFGTGYSSLKYLQEFSFHHLKIDRYFITNIDKIDSKQVIVKSIMQMADNLNIKIIAEGVETEDELCWLRQNNCNVIQGYFFSRPLAPTELKKFLLTIQCRKFQ
ncbi:EAL domain-containing response regulator [Anabaena lutea]|uniref:EAL domain-containing protein n=1 Tax=Anabaena lutea FACHB-196 TaxID=2692881 RepID=A0ABR8FCG7_9NOST|nr:EAL domain-containing protein [Anabaena lutea]MBD2567422.1 EAL domain-containing protein [Anabaena lutea FACHB-196]